MTTRPRSAIEAMVDKACGLSPEEVKRMQDAAAALERKQTQALLAIEKNAKAWWKMHRPVGWTEAQHLKNPTVNCSTPDESRLARSVTKWIKLGG
jgi:hypothetical protein